MKTEEAHAILGMFGCDTVFYTEKGHCFHVLDCPRVRGSRKSEGNVTSIKQAIEWGLAPCRICRPGRNVLYKERRIKEIE